MDAGIHVLSDQSAGSDGTTIIIMGPSGQVQVGDASGIGRPVGSNPSESVPDPVPPDFDEPSNAAVPAATTPDSSIPESTLPSSITSSPEPDSGFSTTEYSSSLTTSLTPLSITTTPYLTVSSSAASSNTILSTESISVTRESEIATASPLPSSSLSVSTRSLSPSLSSSSATTSHSAIVTSVPGISASSSSLSSSTASSSSLSSSAASSRSASQASQTAAYHPLSSTSNELNAHSPTFYIAISVGAVAGAAIIFALFAWCIRVLAKTRRRRKARRTTVPWGDPPTDKDDYMEGGHGDSFSMNMASREDLGAQAWSPRGDRDVGEPQRARCDIHGNALRDHPIIPGHTLPADQRFDEICLGPCRPNQAFRHLPSHLVDETLVARTRQETCPLHSNNPGPPLSLRSGVFAGRGPSPGAVYDEKIPRAQELMYNEMEQHTPPRSMAERMRNIGKSPTGTPEEALGAQHQPTGNTDEAEAWSASLKNSLVSAFNAVATNIAGAPKMDDPSHPLPRRGTRQSVKDMRWEKKGHDVSRGASISSKSSKPWTLEETRDGAGVVHLHINDPREYRGPPPKPAGALTRPIHGPHGRQIYGGMSRESSIYSTLSAYPEWRGQRSRQGTIAPSVRSVHNFRSLRVTNLTHESRQSSLDSVVVQPHPISRLPSTASSANVYDQRRPEIDAAATKALRDRHKRSIQGTV